MKYAAVILAAAAGAQAAVYGAPPTTADYSAPTTTAVDYDAPAEYDADYSAPTADYTAPTATGSDYIAPTPSNEPGHYGEEPDYDDDYKPPHVSYTTSTVQHLTTYCPSATTITYGPGKTITATAHQTLTIIDCNCAVEVPITTSTVVTCGKDCPSPPHATYVPPPPPAANHTVTPPPKETPGYVAPPKEAGAAILGFSGIVAFIGFVAAL